MRYRRLDAKGDMTFGQGLGNFLINSPEAVAQLVMTRLRLNLGEWFYDTSDGTAWDTEVLGERTQTTRDVVVRQRVQTTSQVVAIDSYGSLVNPDERSWTAAMTITTAFGPAALATSRLPGKVPPLPPAPGTRPLLLGVTGASDAPTAMVRANLTQGPVANVTDFQIVRLDPGRY